MSPTSRAVVSAAVLGAALAVPAAASAAPGLDVRGPTFVHDAAYARATTRVTTTTLPHDVGTVRLEVTGFPESAAGRRFGAHVHTGRCGEDPAASGPHYRNPALPEDVPLAAREIWLDLTIRADGSGSADTYVPWTIAQGAANSVVVHERGTDHHTGDAGARLLCTTVPFGS
ncbi:superoxide dismutase family protein [Actinomadura flavalba]|uniref:superoxide dismutase family protein n=1 Tax=Actinomadura flavalba TaxID=1120938 RepID=UPI0003822485|nr:superoxide dismutase family protein [Actinomadura flavalba]